MLLPLTGPEVSAIGAWQNHLTGQGADQIVYMIVRQNSPFSLNEARNIANRREEKWGKLNHKSLKSVPRDF